MVDRQFLAAISLTGMVLDVLGALYLACDLLGGVRGPLRLLTRVVTYMLFFMVGYGLLLGPVFGLVVGVGFGFALGLEYGRKLGEQMQAPPATSRLFLMFGPLRGMVLGLAATRALGWEFGIPFGLLTGSGLLIQYVLGFSPIRAYEMGRKPSLRRQALMASVLRCCSTGSAGIVAGLLAGKGDRAVWIGLKVGFVVGLVSVGVSLFSPLVEWWADHLPAHRLGVFDFLESRPNEWFC